MLFYLFNIFIFIFFRNQKSLKKQRSTKNHIRKKRRKKYHQTVQVIPVVKMKVMNGLRKKVNKHIFNKKYIY